MPTEMPPDSIIWPVGLSRNIAIVLGFALTMGVLMILQSMVPAASPL